MKVKRVVLGILISLLTVASFGAYIYFENTSKLDITIDSAVSEMTVEVGKSFVPPSAKGVYKNGLSGKEDVEVKVENYVNLNKPGSYLVKYIAEHGQDKIEKSVVVKVVDTVPPEIKLVTTPMQYTSPVGKYKEQGFTAIDNVDGDITDRVVRTETHDLVTYTVSDSSGNETTVTRNIVYKDVIAPKVSLNGSQNITISVGGSYSESGATASDEVDGNLTDKITVSGSVNTERRGIYDITYTVTDSAGNVGRAVRTVKVISPQSNNPVVYPGGKVIYLTFDDGPGPYTQRLLDVLDKYNVKATFFVCNKPSYNYLIGEEARRGHTVAVHTNSHNYGQIYSSEAAFMQDIEAMNDIIQAQTGSRSTLLRFPGGSSNTVSRKYCRGVMTQLTGTVVEMGYTYFDWNVSSGDAGGTTNTSVVVQNVKNGCSRLQYSIVLQHDIKGFSVNAVEQIIEWGLLNGYTFLPLTDTSPTAHQRVNN